MAEKGFFVLTEEEYKTARRYFGKRYANRFLTACRKVNTYCRNRGYTVEETDKKMRKVCMKIMVDFIRFRDPRMHTSGDHPSTRTVI